MTIHTSTDVLILIGAIGAAILAVRTVWVYVLVPLRELSEAVPTLMGIAREFEPDSGGSLWDQVVAIRDQVDSNSIRLGNIEQQLEHTLAWDGIGRRSDDDRGAG